MTHRARNPPRERSAEPDSAGQVASQGQRLGAVEKALQKWPSGQGSSALMLGQKKPGAQGCAAPRPRMQAKWPQLCCRRQLRWWSWRERGPSTGHRLAWGHALCWGQPPAAGSAGRVCSKQQAHAPFLGHVLLHDPGMLRTGCRLRQRCSCRSSRHIWPAPRPAGLEPRTRVGAGDAGGQ